MINPAVFYEILAALYCIAFMISYSTGNRALSIVFVVLAVVGYVRAIQLSRKPPCVDFNIGPLYINKEIFNDAGSKDDEGENETGA